MGLYQESFHNLAQHVLLVPLSSRLQKYGRFVLYIQYMQLSHLYGMREKDFSYNYVNQTARHFIQEVCAPPTELFSYSVELQIQINHLVLCIMENLTYNIE